MALTGRLRTYVRPSVATRALRVLYGGFILLVGLVSSAVGIQGLLK
jgi:hypothetical protein